MNQATYVHKNEMPASLRAAEKIVPVILSVTGPVRSVVDLGGGDGSWLQVFRKLGVEDLLLVDCPEVEPHLVIEKECYQPIDINHLLPELRRFELAVCLECAEHIHSSRAEDLVDWLTASADIVVFSAAIPGQGGKGHINERWPHYWHELFRQRNFVRHDVLRPEFIHDQSIPFWYRQNLFLFAKPTTALINRGSDFVPLEFELVHRSIVKRQKDPGFATTLRRLGPAFVSAVRRRISARPTNNPLHTETSESLSQGC